MTLAEGAGCSFAEDRSPLHAADKTHRRARTIRIQQSQAESVPEGATIKVP
jgi:hypothetical protein